MALGKIKTLVADKGYGFIRPDERGPDVFFHLSALQNVSFEELDEGNAVEFATGEGRNGKPRAVEVRILA